MKKLIIFLAFSFWLLAFSQTTQAQCPKYEYAGSTRSHEEPVIDNDRQCFVFMNSQIVVKIADVPIGKHEQVYSNIPFTIPFSAFNPATIKNEIDSIAADSARIIAPKLIYKKK